jgi:hypothetical protein
MTINIGRYCVPPEVGTNRTIIESFTKSTAEVLKQAADDLYTVKILSLILSTHGKN